MWRSSRHHRADRASGALGFARGSTSIGATLQPNPATCSCTARPSARLRMNPARVKRSRKTGKAWSGATDGFFGDIAKQGVGRARQVAGIEIAGEPTVLQDDGAVGDPLQIGQALGNVENRHPARALTVDQAEQTFGIGFPGKAAVGSSRSATWVAARTHGPAPAIGGRRGPGARPGIATASPGRAQRQWLRRGATGFCG